VTIDPGTTEVFGTIGPASGYVFPANSPSTVRFYFAIVTKEQYDIATVSHGCGRFPFGIVHEVVTLSYSLDWKNPTPGLYYFIFQGLDDHISWNYPQFHSGVTIPIIISLSNLTTSTMYTVIANSVTLTATQTVTSERVTTVSGVLDLLTSPLVVGVTVIVATVVALFYSKTRKSDALPRDEQLKLIQTESKKTEMFCNQCGAIIPRDSKFCEECGHNVGPLI